MRFWILLLIGPISGCSKENNISTGAEDGLTECGGAPTSPGLIDDFECGEPGFAPPWEGRTGGWFTVSDGAEGNTFVDENDPSFDVNALRCLDFGYEGGAAGCARGKTADCGEEISDACWGAGLAFSFMGDGTRYDAASREYTGVRFLWRQIGASGTLPVRLNVADVNTHPAGGVCSTCLDFFGADLTVGSTWTEVTLRWGDLAQLGWGDPRPEVAASAIQYVEWRFAPGLDVNLYIDDFAFISD
jgi:hypothetical protein